MGNYVTTLIKSMSNCYYSVSEKVKTKLYGGSNNTNTNNNGNNKEGLLSSCSNSDSDDKFEAINISQNNIIDSKGGIEVVNKNEYHLLKNNEDAEMKNEKKIHDIECLKKEIGIDFIEDKDEEKNYKIDEGSNDYEELKAQILNSVDNDV
jgi:hypothetical protein